MKFGWFGRCLFAEKQAGERKDLEYILRVSLFYRFWTQVYGYWAHYLFIWLREKKPD